MKKLIVVIFAMTAFLLAGLYVFGGVKVYDFNKTPLSYDPVSAKKILTKEKMNTTYRFMVVIDQGINAKKHLNSFPQDAIIQYYIAKEWVTHIFTNDLDNIKIYQ